MELPECPVCLQTYNADDTVPRVLSCGHSACESCIAHLSSLPPSSSSFADTIRCPGCTQVVRCPRNLGPAALPKNIDLLRLCSSSPTSPKRSPPPPPPLTVDFLPLPWTRQLYSICKRWIAPPDAIEIGTITEASTAEAEAGTTATTATTSSSSSIDRDLRYEERQLVSLLPIGHYSSSTSLSSTSTECKEFKLSYMGRVMEVLSRMGEKERLELRSVVEAVSRLRRGVCKVYGLWMEPEKGDSPLYLVCERFQRDLLDVLYDKKERSLGVNTDAVLGFVTIGLEMCEAVMGLHSRGIACGCLAASCFCFDDYGHCLLDINNVLLMGRRVQKGIHNGGRVNGSNSTQTHVFVSPELVELLHGRCDSSNRGSEAGCGSDIWSLACILAVILLGDETLSMKLFEKSYDKNAAGLSEDLYKVWLDKVVSALEVSTGGTSFEPLQQIIEACLSYDPGSRPSATDLWRCLRGLLFKDNIGLLQDVDAPLVEEDCACCLLLSDIASMPKQIGNVSKGQVGDLLQENDQIPEGSLPESKGMDAGQIQQVKVDENLIKGMHEGVLKSATLQVHHRDCVTGLAVGGGFLFSSSYDKTVQVWSLQDFSHVQSLRGHEHRVMAVVVVESSQILCVSGDSGGFIFVWAIGTTTEQCPLKQWREHDDWRYSGVHSLAVLGSQYLYNGSGDKSIKVWSLQDYSLACTMTGHVSTVSSLVVSNGILYSGSWDGTVRLWWLDDHTPLTVLGNDSLGNGCSVLSLSVSGHLLIASYENGYIKIWRNDELKSSVQIHNGAIFASQLDRSWLFTGGWDKIIKVQELSEDEFQVDAEAVGSIACDSIITSLLYWQGKLFTGSSDKNIKVYYHVS